MLSLIKRGMIKLEIVFAVDATIITICIACYVMFCIQQDYCDGVMKKYKELIERFRGGKDEDENEYPGGGN